MRRERLIRNGRNPLDISDETDLYERFRQGILNLVDELQIDIKHETDRNAALPPNLL